MVVQVEIFMQTQNLQKFVQQPELKICWYFIMTVSNTASDYSDDSEDAKLDHYKF